jgi:hypothetical protein
MVGYTEEELRAVSFLDVTHEDNREANRALITELVEGKRQLITPTSYFSRQRVCALLLELLGEENTCALMARAHGWPPLFRARMENGARALRPRPGGRSQSID